jgi:hypothetical protein
MHGIRPSAQTMQILQREDEVSGWVPEEEATGRFACMPRAACNATYIVHAQTEKSRTDETNETLSGVSYGFNVLETTHARFVSIKRFPSLSILIYAKALFLLTWHPI